VLTLFGWAALLGTLWCALTEAIIIFGARYIALIFGDGAGLVDASITMLRHAYAAQVLAGLVQLTLPLLQAKGHVWAAVALSVMTQFAFPPLAAVVLFYTDASHDIFRLIWFWAIGEAFGFLVSIPFAIVPLLALRREARKEKDGLSGVELGTAQGYTQGLTMEPLTGQALHS
jgi:Na+-driven multidrug efflux pump